MNNIIEIGTPGKFDPLFGLYKQHRKAGQIPRYVYLVVWKDSGHKVKGTPGFYDPLRAEKFVKKHRNRILDEIFENNVLLSK